MTIHTFADLIRRVNELRKDQGMGSSDRPSSRFESEDGSGVIYGVLSASDADSAGGADARTVRTPKLRKALQDLGTTPRGKHRKQQEGQSK